MSFPTIGKRECDGLYPRMMFLICHLACMFILFFHLMVGNDGAIHNRVEMRKTLQGKLQSYGLEANLLMPLNDLNSSWGKLCKVKIWM